MLQFLSLTDSALVGLICLAAAALGFLALRRADTSPGCDPELGTDPAPDPWEEAPCPVWTCDDSGRLLSSNAAYRRHATGSEPDVPLFPVPGPETAGSRSFRAELHLAGAPDPQFFDVTIVPVPGGWRGFALPAGEAADAESKQKELTQTLAKTFAHLSTGLAIFDRQGRLQLFNPALVDLCGLPVDFLSARPDLATFFDGLRERQTMPEPRDYTNWREHIAHLAEAAANGLYQETWTLASGSVYEVIGRPHPGGATAFLFQDISAEVSLARQFRSDLEINLAILEAVTVPLCVFSSAGVMTFANPAYDRFWGRDLSSGPPNLSIEQAVEHWMARSARETSWDLLQECVRNGISGGSKAHAFRLTDGRGGSCGLAPLPNGATLIQFHPQAMSAAPARATLPEAV